MELLGGCYEQILFGFAVRPGEKWEVVPDFTHHAHSASLSAIAVNDRDVVTGSRDETIQIYDMKKKTEHGALMQHNEAPCICGSINESMVHEDFPVHFSDQQNGEASSERNSVCMGHVTSLSIHPSGKLALSVGTDKTLRTWNLVEGRSAFIKNLKQNAHLVRWSPSGEMYIVVIANKMDMYKLETASVSGTIVTEKRISSVQFITDTIVAVAGDEEFVRLFDCKSAKCVCEFKAHENRIKEIYSFEMEGSHILVTASNDGYIKMWRLDLDKMTDSPSLLCEVNTKARLTCLAVWLKRVSETKQTANEAMVSSAQVCEAEEPLIKKKKICWIDCDKSAEGDGQEAYTKRKSADVQQKKKKLQKLK
ncbi:p21-activated protein kinase-interacting protein 1 isoform X2 [Varanus komodoensis]|uniref:p21-activated protein kinase-interacting protein 1 isoform X2 n=1 Tax=Varanus komodoensis TaxID=61221 RepID=UPI001CF7D9E2|nr:p21-activated protein kinase-interacting protein 1 isoform X2 [Varanus komodoensis]